MLLQLPGVLASEHVREIRVALEAMAWVGGKVADRTIPENLRGMGNARFYLIWIPLSKALQRTCLMILLSSDLRVSITTFYATGLKSSPLCLWISGEHWTAT